MRQMELFSAPLMSMREFVRQKLRGLEWRQRARKMRRERRARRRKGLLA